MSEESGNSKYRELSGIPKKLSRFLTIALVLIGAIYAAELNTLVGLPVYNQQYLGLFLGLGLAASYLLIKPSPKLDAKVIPWYDYLMAFLSIITGGYVAIWYPQIADNIAVVTTDKWVFGTMAIILVSEAVRRTFGMFFVTLCLIFLVYPLFNVPWTQVAGEAFLGSAGMLGVAFWTLASIVLVFVLFGQLMFSYGGGAFLTDIAMILMGRFRGGPAKVAVLSSALFGSISGSAVSNVMVTGSVTIPLMKKIGYRPHVAGAIEATASTGGMIMPPVMAATSFLMAQYLQIPYSLVVKSALVPALLYFFSLIIQVDLEAARTGLKGLHPSQLPKFSEIFKNSWIMIPFSVLIVTMFVLNYQPTKAGMAAIAVMLIMMIRKLVSKAGIKTLLDNLESAGIAIIELGLIGALVGLITTGVAITGLGFTSSMVLAELADKSLILLLLTTAIVSLILGMGLPGITIYLLQVVLIAPAMISIGIDPIAAHLFIIYFSTMSMITPPVCVAAFAAAALAKADKMKTGIESAKLGIVAFIIPFLFVKSPELLLKGTLFNKSIIIGTSALGIFAVSLAIRGFFFSKIPKLQRILLLGATATLISPIDSANTLFYIVNALGFVVVLGILIINVKNSKTIQQAEQLNSQGI